MYAFTCAYRIQGGGLGGGDWGVLQHGGPQKWVNDRIPIKNTNCIKSALISFLKVCLYSCYINSSFNQISLFHELEFS